LRDEFLVELFDDNRTLVINLLHSLIPFFGTQILKRLKINASTFILGAHVLAVFLDNALEFACGCAVDPDLFLDRLVPGNEEYASPHHAETAPPLRVPLAPRQCRYDDHDQPNGSVKT
jgi:hypothetical protein